MEDIMEIITIIGYNGSSGLRTIKAYKNTKEGEDLVRKIFEDSVRQIEPDITDSLLEDAYESGCYFEEGGGNYREVWIKVTNLEEV